MVMCINPFVPSVPKMELQNNPKIAKKTWALMGLIYKTKFLYGPVSSNIFAPGAVLR